jgi:hypothetical protein
METQLNNQGDTTLEEGGGHADKYIKYIKNFKW